MAEDLTPRASPTRGIAALDRIAEQLADAAGLRLGIADSPAELIAAHRLRYRDASEQGRATAEADVDGMARDGFDSRALQICGWDGEVLVATLPLVLPMPGKRLPCEHAFEVSVEPSGEVVDLGRPLVATGLRGDRARRASAGLLAQAWFEARARGYTAMAGVAPPADVERYRALGLAVEVLAPSDSRRALFRVPELA